MAKAAPNRATKDNGTTAWVTGDTINQTDLETDHTAITDQLDGNIEDVNVSASADIQASKLLAGSITDTQISGSADIAISKLLQTAGAADGSAGLDADIVQSYAASDAEYTTVTDPLDSTATPSIPAHLEDEWERSRFASKRYGPGIATRVGDGTAGAAWFDGEIIGGNLVPNGSFLDNNVTPLGCTVTGAPATQELTTLDVDEGFGSFLNIADTSGGGGAETDGLSWTMSGLRDGTLYLIEVRVLNTTAEVNLTTTGAIATGSFVDLALQTNSTTDAHPASQATDWQTMAGLIETKSDGTDIVIKLNPSATTYEFGTAYVGCYEVAGSRDFETTGREHKHTRSGNITLTATSESATVATIETDTRLSVTVPGDGYQISVFGNMTNGTTTRTASIEEKVDALNTNP